MGRAGLLPEGLPEREIEAGGGFPFLENLGVEREGERREEIDAAAGDEILLAQPPMRVGERGEIDRKRLLRVGGGGDGRVVGIDGIEREVAAGA